MKYKNLSNTKNHSIFSSYNVYLEQFKLPYSIPNTLVTLCLLFLQNWNITAQCTPVANAVPGVTLTYVQGGGTNASGVAFNPNFSVYYAAIAGNSGFPLETFSAAGAPLFQTNTGFDMRGLWWNVNTNQLESNGYNTLGIWSYNINASGFALNTGTQIFTGMNQPTAQSVGDYNCADNEIIYYNAGAIMRRNRNTNALIGSLPITGLPVALANLNDNSVCYTDCLGHEIAILDYVLKRLYFINKTTGAYNGMSQLPATAVTNVSFRTSWANGLFWIYNTGNRTWSSYQVLTGISGTCSFIVCTPPTIIIDDLVACAPNSVDLNNAINAASYPGTASFYATNANATAASSPISNLVTVSGIYYVRLQDPSDPTCFSVASINVTINPVYNTNQTVNACQNSTVTYPDGTSALITASTTYTSSFLTAAGCDSLIVTNVIMDPVYAISTSVNACQNSTVTYPDGSNAVIVGNTSHVSNLLSAAGCDSIITTNVTMLPNYVVSSAINACQNSTVTYPDGTSAVIIGNTSHISNLLSVAGCDSVVTTNVTMNPLTVSGTNGTVSFCLSDAPSDLFTQLGGTANAGGIWTPAMASGTGVFNPASDPSGTYTYTVTNPCGTSSSSVVVSIAIGSNPGTNGTITFCSNDASSNLFSALGGSPDTGGTWSPAMASGSGFFNPAVDAGGIYTYSITTPCGTFTSQVTVTLNQADIAAIVYFGAVFCIDDLNPIPLNNGTTGGIFTITGSGVIDATTGEIDLSASGVGGYGVTYTTNGPCPTQQVFDISILNTADATILPSGPFCEGDDPVQLQALNSGGTWSGIGVTSTGLFDPSLSNVGLNPITYTIPGQCGDAQTIQIDITPTPSVSTISDTIINSNASVYLYTSTSASNYTWSPATWLNCNDCLEPISSPEETITYTITVEENGCFNSAEVTVLVLYDPVVFVPNIFSPNGDNENDILYVRGKGISTMRFIVYDRWGEKVFESTSTEEGWDGFFRGKKMNPAVFVYYLDVDFKDGTSVSQKGDITLIR